MNVNRVAVSWCCASLIALGCGGAGEPSGGAGTGGGGAGGAGGAPSALVTEAGFLDVPGGVVGPVFASRLFYSFRPADSAPETKPLLLLFNGGPGSATSSYLLMHGTGPLTLDTFAAPDADPEPNPHSFTRFANVLYIDERYAGYSYALASSFEGEPCATPTTDGAPAYLTDAGDYVFALLSFLDAHESLRGAPVTVLGESYGGTRAPLMLYLLQRYASEWRPDGPEEVDARLPWLRERVQQHFDLLQTASPGTPRTPDEVAEQFGRMVLVQGNVAGLPQLAFEAEAMSTVAPFDTYLEDGKCVYDVRFDQQYCDDLDARSARAARTPEVAGAMLGLPLDSIDGLSAAERGDAFRPLSVPVGTAEAEGALRALLGELPADDAYWVQATADDCPTRLGDLHTFAAWFDVVTRTRTLMTNAQHDAAVYTPAFPTFLASYFAGTTHETTLPADAARPGLVRYDGPLGAFEFRFPRYESGHMVSGTAAAELADDLQDWLAQP